MGEILTCLEHQSIPVRHQRQAGDAVITVSHARQLACSPGIPRDAFRWGHQSIQWRQFCGVVQLDGLTLEILPKIHGKESDPGASKAALIKMLRRAGILKVYRGGSAFIDVQRQALLDIFIQEFCQLLQEQSLMGKPRAYQQQEANLTKLKGKLLTSQQLRKNLVHRERLYCEFDELSEDILINRIVKFTLKLLLLHCRSGQTKKSVTEQLMVHDEISDRQITIDDVARVNLDRTNERYRSILDWCRLFINSQSPDITGGDRNLLSMLFDMNRLFEHWLAVELRPIAHRIGLRVREQSPRRYLAYREDLGQRIFQTRPDIGFFDSDGSMVWLLDAKWKLLDPSESKLGVSQADLYQLSSYAQVYDLRHIGLVYPRQAGMKPFYNLKLSGKKTVNVMIASVEIHHSLSEQWHELPVPLSV